MTRFDDDIDVRSTYIGAILKVKARIDKIDDGSVLKLRMFAEKTCVEDEGFVFCSRKGVSMVDDQGPEK